jgi:hypothetical protein
MNLNQKAAKTAPDMLLKLHRTCIKNCADYYQKLHQEETAPRSRRDCT